MRPEELMNSLDDVQLDALYNLCVSLNTIGDLFYYVINESEIRDTKDETRRSEKLAKKFK